MGGESATTVEGTWSSSDERTRTAVARLAAALGPRSGHVVVTGSSAEAAEALLWRVEASIVSYRCGWLDGTALDAVHLLRALGVEDAEPRTLPATMRALLKDAGDLGRPLVVVVRRADGATPEALEQLRLLLEGDMLALETVRLVLLGGPALSETLRQPSLRALASRVTSIVAAPEDVLPASLEVTSRVLNESRRRAEGRSRWPHPWRVVAAGLLGSALATAVVAFVMPPDDTPSPTPIPAAEVAVVSPASPNPPPATEPARVPAASEAITPTPASLPRPVPTAVVHPAPPSGRRSIQVGAFRDPARAGALREELAKRFEWVLVTRIERDGVVWHRVRIEGLETPAAVNAAMTALRRVGHQPIAVRD